MSIGGYIKNKQPLVYRTFSSALESGKLAHAYLLLGEAGTPLKEAAMYLAKSVLCDYPNPLADEECIICRRIEMNDYPDFIFYDGEENSVKKGDISSLTALFSQTPLESKGIMVYVINHVENMTVDAANSLLKFLEEPPSNTYAFLTSQNEAKVLPTIISRCEKLRLLLSSRKEVIEEAKNLGVDKEDAEILSHFINDAELLKAETENGDYQTIKDALGDFLDALVQNKGKARFIMETNVIPVLKTKQGLRLFFDIFVLILEEAISKKRGSPIFLESYDTILTALANKLPHLEDTVLSVMTMRGEIELNINSGLLLTHLVNEIAKE